MKKTKKILPLCIAILIVMQIILPTIAQAVTLAPTKLNIQFERPYTDDDGDGTVGNDVYTLVRQAIQTVFKIGNQDENGDLSFDIAYYCLRGGLGFGSTEEILASGVDYTILAELNDKDAVINYFKDSIGYDIPEENYNAICWIAENMYLPKSEYAEEMKEKLLSDAGITSSLLTDDDIEVVQQIALWYFTNYDENGGENSVSLADSVDLANLLQINNTQPDNDTSVAYNKNRGKQINTLYRYFIDNAKTSVPDNQEEIPEELELDKNLEPAIQTKVVPGTKVNAYVVGPFKINEKVKGNIDYTFNYSLQYKTTSTQEEWSNLEIDNTMGTVYLSDTNGTALDRTKNIEDMIAGDEFYITILKDVLDISSITEFSFNINYDSYYFNTSGEILTADIDDQPVLKVEKEKITNPGEDNITIKPEEKEFDLALRKFITSTAGKEITDRIPVMYLENLRNGTDTEAVYEHPKNAIYLKRGNTIIYTIRIYNQGELDGYATEITDYLCEDLEFIEDSEINKQYGWVLQEDGKTLKTTYLADKLIKAYDTTVTAENVDRDANWQQAEDGTDGLYYEDIQIECKIKENATIGITLPNVAEISVDKAVNDIGEEVDIDDRDSTPGSLQDDDIRNYENNPWYEDDDDYERVIVEPDKAFDLALRKYISNIERKGESVEFDSRVPEVDTTPLNQNQSTADYIHSKEVLTVKHGDIITYKLRIYNEGELDGYATEITDYIPEGLGLLVGYSGNSNWLIETTDVENKPLVGENGFFETEEDVYKTGIFKDEDLSKISIVTGKNGGLEIRDYLSLKDELIKKHGADYEEGDLYQQSINDDNDGLFYREIEVTCIVLAPNTWQGTITNIAEISEDKAVDDSGEEVDVDDRDSTPDNLTEEERDNYEEHPWYEDDDDYEPVQLKYFDLALRKFITGVNDTNVDTRIPEFYIDEEGNYRYKHDKTPVEVVNNDNVTYTIRIYNEGTIAGYAEEIEDDIPEGLIFLPEDETNKEYGWKMYYRDDDGNLIETDNEEEAEVVRTTYLSEANGTIDEETGKNSNLLEVFDKDTMEEPDYRDIKIVFKVSQKDIPEDNTDGIIINKAQITEDSDDDEDSTPDEWNEGEDDQDKEYVYVQKFDLALYKWVTKTSVTVDGKTTITETGFKPNIGKTEGTGDDYRENSEEEPIASVTIDKKKLNSTVVKFIYSIKVVNEGDIEGYATEITDYIPEGLKFVAEDNPLWTQTEDGKITTRALETKLLKPGESAEIEVTFTWINDANNLGLKTNIAAITEDYNDKGVPDEDSEPGNEDIPNYEEEQEDDDDFALVILTIKTGGKAIFTYSWLMILAIAIIASGIILIKKYVL